MMGPRQEAQPALLYAFSLEDHIPMDHLLRSIDRVPDHATFSKKRYGRFRDSGLLRHLFETTVARCIEEGLVSGQRMAIDASLIEADANKQNATPKDDWDAVTIDPADAPRAMREYLDTLDEAAFGAASQWTAARKGRHSSAIPTTI